MTKLLSTPGNLVVLVAVVLCCVWETFAILLAFVKVAKIIYNLYLLGLSVF